MVLKKRRWLHRSLILATAFTVVVATLPIVTLANGRVTSFERKTAGPYEIALGTIPPSPSVGSLHFTIMVSVVATNTLVLDADIAVVGVGPESSETEIGPIVATNNALDPSFYDVNTAVDREGIWVFTTTITDSKGEHSADFHVEVKNASTITGILTLGALLAFLVIFGLSIRTSIGGRRKRPKRRKAQRHTQRITQPQRSRRPQRKNDMILAFGSTSAAFPAVSSKEPSCSRNSRRSPASSRFFHWSSVRLVPMRAARSATTTSSLAS